MVRCCEKRKKW